MDEVVLFNRHGRGIYRLRADVVYDYKGQARGFLVGRTLYNVRGEHRGYYFSSVVRDRMGRVIGFASGAKVAELALPFPEVPPLGYKVVSPPEPPDGLVDHECKATPPLWSIMPLENLLV